MQTLAECANNVIKPAKTVLGQIQIIASLARPIKIYIKVSAIFHVLPHFMEPIKLAFPVHLAAQLARISLTAKLVLPITTSLGHFA